MKLGYQYIILLISVCLIVVSCSTLEKASMHGISSGNYILKTENKITEPVYLDVSNEQIVVYQQKEKKIDNKPLLSIPLIAEESPIPNQIIFKKQSLDIDITSILLKHRPSVSGLPAQLITDFNIAGYVGWRFDKFILKSKKDPLGKSHQRLNNFGYDFGFFAGPGITTVSPFNTLNRRTDEYSGMIIQTGIAGFIESNVASFGLSIGYDHLMNADRKIWIYRNKPWIGFIVGIALH